MENAWNQWQLVAWAAPVAWAITSLIDVLLIDRCYYRNAAEGTMITAIFGAVPCLLIALAAGGAEAIDVQTALLAVLAGAAFALHSYAYFGALFRVNDVAHVDTTFNANVAVVPLLAYFLVGERLALTHYAGIGLAGLGIAVLLAKQQNRGPRTRPATAFLVTGVLTLSVSLVLLEAVFQQCSYWAGLLWSSGGWLFTVLLLAGRRHGRVVIGIARSHAGIFAVNELIGGIAIMGTLRATDLSPSVSMIPVIETTTPIIILALSLTAVLVLRLCPGGLRHASYAPFRAQLETAPRKLLASAFILAGVYAIGQPHGPTQDSPESVRGPTLASFAALTAPGLLHHPPKRQTMHTPVNGPE